MIKYDPKNPAHEMLALGWWLKLKEDPIEFANLFSREFKFLTPFMFWCAHNATIVFDCDKDGLWACAWTVPDMDGAFFGAWFRHDRRHGKETYKFIMEAYRLAFERYPTLVGITKQQRLRDLHLKLGYEFRGELPSWFDGDTAFMYVLTRESFYGGRRQRKNEYRDKRAAEPVQSGADERVPDGAADAASAVGANGGSAPDGRSEREHTLNKFKRRVRKRSVQHKPAGAAPATGGIGTERVELRDGHSGPKRNGSGPRHRQDTVLDNQ